MRKGILATLFCLLALTFLWVKAEVTDHHEAIRDLARRATEGEAKALYDLAKLHDIGYDTISIDSLRSSLLYLASAKKGYPPAMNFIGFRYYNGDHVRQDIDSALYWIRAAGHAGDLTAATNLGYLLTQGEGVSHDEDEAVYWLTKASEGGVKEAQVNLIELMEEKWEALPADSALSLGTRYYVGSAPIIGVKLIEIASRYGSPKSKALLGDAYSKGRGVVYNHQKSIEYFYAAATAGDPSAQYILAELLDIFPDALLELFYDGETCYYEAPILPSPHDLYEKAAEGGVVDSESAYRLLYGD
ncbi:MAG: sel1 repeat family protein [Muribaculaceae bacterium]|nr:sel1 repeat family protein [Muribaculaceae bacterium]